MAAVEAPAARLRGALADLRQAVTRYHAADRDFADALQWGNGHLTEIALGERRAALAQARAAQMRARAAQGDVNRALGRPSQTRRRRSWSERANQPRLGGPPAGPDGEAMFGRWRRRPPAPAPVPARPAPAPPPPPTAGLRRPIGFGRRPALSDASSRNIPRPIGFGHARRPPRAERWRSVFERLEGERARLDARLADLQEALVTGALPAGSARAAAAPLLARRRSIAARLARIGANVPPVPWIG